MTMAALNTIANATAANATPVQANFATIATYVDTSLLNKDGSVAVDASADLTLGRAPTSDLHAATKKYVDDSAGSVLGFEAMSASTGSVAASTPTDLPGLSVTFTAESDHLYRYTLSGAVVASLSGASSSDWLTAVIFGNGGGSDLYGHRSGPIPAATLVHPVGPCTAIQTGLSGSYTVKARVVHTGSGVTAVFAEYSTEVSFMVEDLGVAP